MAPTLCAPLAEASWHHRNQLLGCFNRVRALLGYSLPPRCKKAKIEMEKAEASFERAIQLYPDEAQAYANMAQFCHNTNQLVRAVEYWTSTIARVGQDAKMVGMFEARRVDSLYGMHAMNRDNAYKEGQGNLTEALVHAGLQLGVYNSPVIMFDVATMQVMASNN